MDSPLAYIPIDRRQALGQQNDLPLRSRGAALFADISGFTPLTEMLAFVLGPRRGAEELTHYLNQVYDALIEQLHQFGGSVIGFSGDAITCWFADDDGRHATATAIAMQNAMNQFVDMQIAGDQLISLAMKAAVSVGEVLRFVVGNPDYTLLDVMAGKTLEDLAAAEAQANRGEVILSATAVKDIEASLQIIEWRTDEAGHRFAVVEGLKTAVVPNPWPTPFPPLSETQKEAWLLPNIYRRLRASKGNFLAELRTATALFVRFSGIDYDNDPTAPQKLDAFIQQVQAVLTKYDGSLLQLTIGDKGSYLYGAFGAPISHEDDTARAASAALDIQAIRDQLDFLQPMQMGIAFGRMRVGPYGSQARRTYGVLGDAVNLSARLMSGAQPGQILIEQEAFQKIGAGYISEALPPRKFKGKTHSINIYELVRRRRRQLGRATFVSRPVGRDQLLHRLQAYLDQAKQGQGQIVQIVGQPGMGKSHLATYFAQEASIQHAQVLHGTSQSVNRGTLYFAWRQIFFALFALLDIDEAEISTRLQQQLLQAEPAWKLRLPLLGDLLDLPIPDNPTTAALDSDMRQKALYSLVVDILQRYANEQPLVLLLEDIHWIDDASRALTTVIARQAVGTSKIMLLLVQRTEELGKSQPFDSLSELSYCHNMAIEELSESSVAQFVEERLMGRATPLLVDVVQRMSNHNPFFITQLIETMQNGEQIVEQSIGQWGISESLLSVLRQADFIRSVNDEWRLQKTADLSTVRLDIPESIHELILARLDKLPEEHKLTLKVSSVIGFFINLALVSRAHPTKKAFETILSEAKYLETEKIIQAEEISQNLYAFRHHTVQEVIYETLLFTQRVALHKAIAEVLANLYPEATSQIAHHAYLGELWSISYEFNLLSGEQAKHLHANEQSIFFFNRALESIGKLENEDEKKTAEKLKSLHLLLGEQHIAISNFELAQHHLDQALQFAQDQGDIDIEANVCRWLGRSFEMRGENERALEWLNRGLNVLEANHSIIEAEICLIAGLINTRLGQYDRAKELCERSLQVCELLNDLATEARTYNLLGIVEMRGESEQAINIFKHSLSEYEQLDNIYGQASTHNLLANGYFTQSKWNLAKHHYDLSLKLFQQTGDVYRQVLVSNNMAGIARNQGDLSNALAYYQRALRLLTQIGGSLWVLGALHLNLGHTYLRNNELDKSQASLTLAQNYFSEAKVRHLLPELNAIQAELWLARGNIQSATENAKIAISLSEEMSMPREKGQYLRVMGDINLAKGNLEDAKNYLESSKSLLISSNDIYEQAKTNLSLGKLFISFGDNQSAITNLGEAEETFKKLGVFGKLKIISSLKETITR